MSIRHAMRFALLRQLTFHGWKRIRIENRPASLEGAEVWELESVWSPPKLRAYLQFQLDPVIYHASVLVRGERPENGRPSPHVHAHYLGWRWNNAIPAIISTLLRLRESRLNRPPLPTSLCGRYDLSSREEALALSAEVEKRLCLLRGHLSDRKLRLFACACLRRLQCLMTDERNRRAVEVAERYADGLVPRRDMKMARRAARMPWLASLEGYDDALNTVRTAALVAGAEQQRHCADLLNDIAGLPNQSMSLLPSRLRPSRGSVAMLARTIYNEGFFANLPILADALEEAGCDDPVILNHCRQPGEHVRGCWVLDLLLGKR